MAKKETLFGIPLIGIILLFSFLFRVNFHHIGIYIRDLDCFIAWADRLVQMPFLQFYDSWCDYTPGYLYILWLLRSISHFMNVPETFLFKLPVIIADCLTGYLIYHILKKSKNVTIGLLGATLYVLNPSILANSSLWGQADSLVALFSIAALYFLDMHYVFSAIMLAFGTLIKIQVGFIAPVILIEMFRLRWHFSKIVIYIVFSGMLYIVGFLPFHSWDTTFLPFVFEKIGANAQLYPYSSVNAFNVWGLFGFWQPEVLWQMICGWLFVAISSFLFVYVFYDKKLFRYILASLIFLTTFLFCTRLHERHLFPAFAPLLILVGSYPLLLFAYFGFSLIYCANLYYALEALYNNTVFSYWYNVHFIFLNLFLYCFVLYELFKECWIKDECELKK